MKVAAIPRLSASEFKPSRWRRHPCVVEGLTEDWQAIERWTPEYLKRVAGDQEVSVRETAGSPRNIYQNLAQGGRIRFSDYVDWITETSAAADLQEVIARFADPGQITAAIETCDFEASYYLDAKLAQLSKPLVDDVTVPDWYPTHPIDVIFWLGILGTSSGLHADVTPNCNVQVSGSKHFLLFSPSEARNLYQIAGRTHCRFDPNLPDYDRFPKASHSSSMETYLKPGEALYIPVGWFHQVTVVSTYSINVNFFWQRQFPQGLATPALWRVLLWRICARTRQKRKKHVPVATPVPE
ncbi:cupin-like domain-containing protein [Rhizobium beringeri]|uniref:cupin-like domain-containing protein n=1 Tax=Rhizobium TaxID=379 RepID=UPI00293DE5AC|nr:MULTISPECIES: cupin-like domain-containing protein [Rhizobium]MDV4166166.1 cupin-like domain-containing protein [Rhizobium leguminosarum]MDV4176652.1 cupin-like domain-containing protein [Rhizobium leguminosarum]WSG91506.1 cupin-like domain-containing protein [Rhizobium beringeri]